MNGSHRSRTSPVVCDTANAVPGGTDTHAWATTWGMSCSLPPAPPAQPPMFARASLDISRPGGIVGRMRLLSRAVVASAAALTATLTVFAGLTAGAVPLHHHHGHGHGHDHGR